MTFATDSNNKDLIEPLDEAASQQKLDTYSFKHDIPDKHSNHMHRLRVTFKYSRLDDVLSQFNKFLETIKVHLPKAVIAVFKSYNIKPEVIFCRHTCCRCERCYRCS